MLKIDSISYAYDKKNKIFQDVSFEISSGEFVSLTGLNGSGKSTIIKIILGIILPQSGSVNYDGIDVHSNRIDIMNNVGVVWGQKPTLWWDIPVLDSLYIIRDIYKVNKNQFQKNIDYLDSFLKVSDFWKLPLRKLSLGQRVRAELLAALSYMPDYLILDEPFVGLDYKTKKVSIDLLNDMRKNSKFTLIITSHQMEEIEHLCDRVVFLGGKTGIVNRSVEEIKNDYYCKKILIKHNSENLIIPSITKNSIVNKSGKGITEIMIINKKKSVNEVVNELFRNNYISDIKISDYSIQYAMDCVIGD